MAKFLIVLGGVGRGLLRHVEELGFTGALQIDRNEEIVATSPYTLTIPIPLPNDRGSVSIGVINEYLTMLTERSFTLQQRIHHLEQQLLRLEDIGSSGDERATHKDEHDAISAEYKECMTHIRHAEKARGWLPPTPMISGAECPIVMKAYFSRPNVRNALKHALSVLFKLTQCTESEIRIQLVASMCGGTGNGALPIVIDLINEIFDQQLINCRATISILRVGPIKYGRNIPSMQIKALFALTSDYAILKRHRDTLRINFQYIDFEPVGSGGWAIKAGMLQELDYYRIWCRADVSAEYEVLHHRHNVILGQHSVLSQELNPEEVYNDILQDLALQLNAFYQLPKAGQAEPTQKVTLIRIHDSPPTNIEEFPEPHHEGVIDARVLRRFWLQSVFSREVRPTSATELQQSATWGMINTFFREIICAEKLQQDIAAQSIRVEYPGRSNQFRQFPSPVAYSVEYFQTIRFAKDIIATIDAQVFTTDNAMHQMLLQQWQRVLSGDGNFLMQCLRSDKRRGSDAQHHFSALYAVYVEITKLIEFYTQAYDFLHKVHNDCNVLVDVVQGELRSSESHRNTERIVIVHSLETTFDSKTWLEHLSDALKGKVGRPYQMGEFRERVMLGARGVTEYGLRQLLGVTAEHSIDQIIAMLYSMPARSRNLWFGGTHPLREGNVSPYYYAVVHFPYMDEKIQEYFKQANEHHIQNNRLREKIFRFTEVRSGRLEVFAAEMWGPNEIFSLDASFRHLISALVQADDSLLDTSDQDREVASMLLAYNGEPVYLPAHIADDDSVLKALERLFCETLKDFVTVVRGE